MNRRGISVLVSLLALASIGAAQSSVTKSGVTAKATLAFRQGDLIVETTITNNSGRLMNAIDLKFTFHNNFGDAVYAHGTKKRGNSRKFILQDEVPHGTSYDGWFDASEFGGARKVRVTIVRVNLVGSKSAPAKVPKYTPPKPIVRPEIEVVIDGKSIRADSPPVMFDDRLMLPIAVLAKPLDLTYTWDAESGVLKMNDGSHDYTLRIGDPVVRSSELDEDGVPIEWHLDVPPMVFQGRTYVPAKLAGDVGGKRPVKYDSLARIIYIGSDQ